MSNKELKPCPFCGGEAKYDNSDGYDYIICDECGARNFGFSKEQAYDEWNKRVQCVDDEEIKPEISLDGIHPDLINGLLEAKRNYLEKQDSSNSSEIPNSSIGEKIIDAIIENKLFSVINPRTNKEIEETLVVWAGNANEIIETVVCKKSCKDESATLKTLVHKWTKHSIEDYLYLSVELYKYCVLWFEYWSESGQLAVCIVNNSSEELLYEDIGVFNTIKEANSKVIEFIKKLGERLVYFADEIRTTDELES